MADATNAGGVNRTRGSGRGERLVMIPVDQLYMLLADYTPAGDLPRRGRPLRMQRSATSGLLALVVDGTNKPVGTALRLTVRGAGASHIAIDVSRSDDTDGLRPGELRILTMPDDLVALLRFVSAGAIPPDAEFRGIALNALMGRTVGIRVYANWRDFQFDGRATLPSRDYPFAIDLRYEPGERDGVVVYDERGTPLKRQAAPDRR